MNLKIKECLCYLIYKIVYQKNINLQQVIYNHIKIVN